MVHLTEGTYRIGDGGQGQLGLLIGNNVHLKLDQDATIVRNFLGTGPHVATIRNKYHPADPGPDANSNIRVSGGTIKSVDPAMKGRHFGFYNTDDLTIDNVRLLGVFGDWNSSFQNCDRVNVTSLKIDSGRELNEDGLHFTGGSRIVVSDCNIECGDDCIALNYDSPETASAGFANTFDVTIANCTLWSHKANALKLRVAAGVDRSVRRVIISGIVAKCGDGTTTNPDLNQASGIVITDEGNALRVSDVQINDVLFDASQNLLQPLTIRGVERVALSRVEIRNPKLRSTIDSSKNIDLADCIIDMGTNTIATQQCLLLGDEDDSDGPFASSNIRIRGGLYRGATQHGIQFGSNLAVNRFRVSDVDIENPTNSGLFIFNASHGQVIGNSVYSTNDPLTGSWGIQEVAPSNNNLYVANRLMNMPLGLTFAGGLSQAFRNAADPTKVVLDSGGFRQTVDGFVKASGTNLAQVDMDRVIGRFRAARNGSVTGLVVTNSVDRLAGTLKVTVYRDADPTVAGGGTPLFSTEINSGTDHRSFTTTAEGNFPFEAGDELYIVITTTGWTAGGIAAAAFDFED